MHHAVRRMGRTRYHSEGYTLTNVIGLTSSLYLFAFLSSNVWISSWKHCMCLFLSKEQRHEQRLLTHRGSFCKRPCHALHADMHRGHILHPSLPGSTPPSADFCTPLRPVSAPPSAGFCTPIRRLRPLCHLLHPPSAGFYTPCASFCNPHFCRFL